MMRWGSHPGLLDLPERPAETDAVAEVRREVRAFLATERASGAYVPRCDSWLTGHDPEFSRRLAARGWIGMGIPKRYGGQERPWTERIAVIEELVSAGAPVAAHWVADRQTAPQLLRVGSEAQKRRLLPKIAAGECYFALGLSEPDTGSDLASIRTTATRTDSGWTISGNKVWNSHAHRAHFCTLLCRTAPRDETDRHAGISVLIVDLSLPGVEVRSIRTMTGHSDLAEIFLDDVRVGDDAVLGDVGRGWSLINAELSLERSGPERYLSTMPLIRCMIDHAQSQEGDATMAIGALLSEVVALHELSHAVAAAIDSGRDPVAEALLYKELGTRFEGDVAEIARLALPCEPSLDAESGYAALLAQALLASPGFTLRGGTSEVLRGVVAREMGIR